MHCSCFQCVRFGDLVICCNDRADQGTFTHLCQCSSLINIFIRHNSTYRAKCLDIVYRRFMEWIIIQEYNRRQEGSFRFISTLHLKVRQVTDNDVLALFQLCDFLQHLFSLRLAGK
ncbi:hypothetical protein D3C87_1890360 [compost metagenome]